LKVFLYDFGGEIKYPENMFFGDDVEIIRVKDISTEDTRLRVEKALKTDKVVFVGPSHRISERFFRDPNIKFVNAREQVAWVGHNPEKIRDLIAGSIEKLRNSNRIEKKRFLIKHKSALVIGAGIAGLETARQIANAGYKVYLIEKKPFIGGLVARLDRLYPAGTPNSHMLYPLINEVVSNPNVEVLVNTEVEKVEGVVGDYEVKLKVKGNVVEGKLPRKCEEVCPVEVVDEIPRKAIYYQPTYPEAYGIDFDNCTKCGNCVKVLKELSLGESEKTVHVGAIVVATGLKEYDAKRITEYGYGRYPNVYTKLEFERKFANGLIKPRSVVIVNCAGSRDKNHLPYCSRVCCMLGLKAAKFIKDTTPETEVYVHYIDMRSYGVFEEFYNTVRETYGVKFIQGRPSEILQEEGGKLVVRCEDVLLGKNIELKVDCVVLMTGFVPDKETLDKLRIHSGNSYPVEYVNSSYSIDSNPRGIFIAGSAAYPKDVAEILINAANAPGGVIGILGKDYVENKTPTAEIDGKICGEIDCRICVSSCPYGAVEVKDDLVTVNEEVCMGCGICTATCAAGANQLQGYEERGMLAQIKGMTKEGDIIAFMCKWSSYNAADKAGYERLNYPENVKIIRIPCTGRVSTQMILSAYESGAKAVLVAGCPPDACHYFTGNFKARKRVEALKEMLKQFGINPESLAIEWIGKDESRKFVETVTRLNEQNK
jgi:heterodisulfide reductase subunit A